MTEKDLQNKNAHNKVDISYNFWLGIVNLSQTFEELDEIKDKPAEMQSMRELLDDSDDFCKRNL